MPIAKATNAAVSQVAYTSFEADGSGSWTIGSALRDTGSITGTHCYNLTHGACSRSGLTSSTSYVVSYWSKTGSSFSVSGSTAVVQGKTIAGWTYFEHTVTGVTTETVSGTGDIDELRLYPATAQMTTYTYSPLVGMTSQCDVDNRVTYFSYDGLGRLAYIKDQDGNIVKTTNYHYAGQ
jgi:YD repeat-containing protein